MSKAVEVISEITLTHHLKLNTIKKTALSLIQAQIKVDKALKKKLKINFSFHNLFFLI